MAPRSVRDATFDVFREYGLTTLFANPGSTEISFLTDLPDDLRFVLGLHESSVVGMATGWAIGRGEPALAILHTTPGLGNAVSAIATARVNRAPLVVIVGQQDRRHLATEPFLAGRLHGLAGDYPVWVDQPIRAQDVPGAIARAHHESVTGRGPAVVIVPMDDWSAEASEPGERAAPRRVVRARGGGRRHASRSSSSFSPARRAPSSSSGPAPTTPRPGPPSSALAERLGCPVWQEPFSARAGFPQDHVLFAGHLPADRVRLRQALAPHDLVLAVGAPGVPAVSVRPGPVRRAGDARRDDQPGAGRGTSQHGRARGPGGTGPRLRRARPDRSRPRDAAGRTVPRRLRRRPHPPRVSRSAPPTSSAHSPSACRGMLS